MSERRGRIHEKHELSKTRRCGLLDVARSSAYHRREPVSEADLAVMRLIDEIHLQLPFYGSRRMRDELEERGHTVNRKRVQRLMRQMGLRALYPRRRTSQPGKGHKIYPYLLGVGLKLPTPLPVGGGEAQQPQNERGQRGDEQQRLEALGAFRSHVTQCEPEAVALEVANGLLHLYALSVDPLDSGTGAAVMKQRSGEQPRGSVHLSILRTTSSAFAGPARSSAPGTHQIQPAPVPVTVRQTSPADVAHSRRGLWVQRIDEAPMPCFRSQVFDSISDASNPVPSKRLHVAIPRTAESRIGDHDGSAAHGQDGFQSLQKSSVGTGIVVAAHRMSFFVDRNRSSLHRHRRLEDDLLVLERAVGPIHENHRARDASQHRPRQGA